MEDAELSRKIAETLFQYVIKVRQSKPRDTAKTVQALIATVRQHDKAPIVDPTGWRP